MNDQTTPGDAEFQPQPQFTAPDPQFTAPDPQAGAAGTQAGAGWTPPGSWAPPQTPGMPGSAQPRKRRSRLIWLCVAGALVLLLGGGLFVIATNAALLSTTVKSISAAGAAGAHPCPSTTATPGQRDSLVRDLLPPHPGGGMPGVPHEQVMSLAAFVSTFYAATHDKAAQRNLLTRLCFRFAVLQVWDQPTSGTVVGEYLVRFGSAAGAHAYILSLEAVALASSSSSGHRAVPGVPDGMLVQFTSHDLIHRRQTQVLGDRGSVAILFLVNSAAKPPSSAAAASLLRRQSARI